jgi:uncharacterized SAM-binding protein YcdF (DUF218 family)
VSNYTIWGLFGPATWPWWLATLALLSTFTPRGRRWTRRLAGLAVAAFVTLALLPAGHWLAEPLERRFPAPDLRHGRVDHIIVLAGAERLAGSARRGEPEVSGAAERIIDGAALARTFPAAQLWIVGGVRDRRSPLTDADWTARTWRRLGVPPARTRIVRETLDTCANAAGVAAQRPRGSLLLVTSALHMPRAVACFRAHGLRPLPYPVDYLNPAVEGPLDALQPNLAANMERSDRAIHEWLGLLLYRLRGRIDEIFPRP